MNPIELRKFIPLFPFGSPEDHCVMSKRGDITFGWRVAHPVAASVNEPGYDSIIADFRKAYKILPSYCIIHKQDIFKYDVYKAKKKDEFIAQCEQSHYDGRRFLNGYCYLFLTFSTKAVIEMPTKGTAFYSPVTSVKRPSEEHIRRCADIASQFEAALANNSLLYLRPLRAKDLIRSGSHGEDRGLLPDYLNMFAEGVEPDYPLEFKADHIRYADRVAKFWYVEDSDSYEQVVSSVSGFDNGGGTTCLSGGAPFGINLRIPHVVNRYVVTLPQKTVENELMQKAKIMTSFSFYSAQDAVNAESINMYLGESANDAKTTVKCFTDVMAWGRESDMVEIRNLVTNAFRKVNITVAEETRVAPALYYAAIPGAAAELGYDFLMTSELNCFLCHGLWDGYDEGIPGGLIQVCDRQRLIPMPIDLQSEARNQGFIADMNAVIVGPSGSGKSFTMNHLVQNYYNSNQHIFIIDIGDSYQGICRLINEETGGKDGIYNSYDPAHPMSFNPFLGRKHWGEVGEDGETTQSGMEFLLSLVQTMFLPRDEGWLQSETTALESFINQFFYFWDNGYENNKIIDDLQQAYVNERRRRAEKDKKPFREKVARASWTNPFPEIFADDKRKSDPVFDDFYMFITLVVQPLMADDNFYDGNTLIRQSSFDIDDFALAIKKYSRSGIYSFLLNSHEQVDFFSSRLTVFEVDQIKDNKDLFPLWLLCIIHSFEGKMRSLPCQKVMIIEEAWSAIAKPSMAKFITWMWRTARKFRTSAVVVTQSITDLISSDIIKDAIILNSSVRILLDHSKNKQNLLDNADVFSFDQMQVDMILSINKNRNPDYKYKEAFISIGSEYCNVFAIEVSPEAALIYESDKTLKKPLFDKAKEVGSFIEAVKILAEENRQSKNQKYNL